jgi:hypothetical protein
MLSGFVPDGYLIRLSSLSSDSAQAYRQHLVFAEALLEQIDPALRGRLVGSGL